MSETQPYAFADHQRAEIRYLVLIELDALGLLPDRSELNARLSLHNAGRKSAWAAHQRKLSAFNEAPSRSPRRMSPWSRLRMLLRLRGWRN